MKSNLIFTFLVSISAILLGHNSNWLFFLGIGAKQPDMLEGLYVTVIFLVTLLLYGMIKGYTKKSDFIKFASLYWGIGSFIVLIAIVMEPIGKFALIVIPIDMLILVPTIGLKYFFAVNNGSYLIPLVSLISSWSVSVIGYILGYQTKKLKQTLSDKT